MKINSNLIRIYAEVDPTLAKILRNIRLALEKSDRFEQMVRFGESHIFPAGCDPLLQRPPIQQDDLRQSFAQVVLVHDNIPTMLSKLQLVLLEQTETQRVIPVIIAALLFKEIHVLGWESDGEADVTERGVVNDQLMAIVDDVCRLMRPELHHTYVVKGKLRSEAFEQYFGATRAILRGSLLDSHLDGSTYHEYLEEQIPGLTKESYRADHRQVLEYIVKLARERLRQELKKA